MTFSTATPNVGIMRSFFPLYRIRALWATGAILALASPASSQQALSADQIKAIETQRREALKNRHTIDENGEYGIARRIKVFPIEELSKELEVKDGAVSLLPDLKDHGGERTAVYLLNTTDTPLNRADSDLLTCFMEVKDVDRWRSCQDSTIDCGTGAKIPEDLAPGHGKLLFGWDPTVGDMTGELRYCVRLPHARPVVSASFQGRYSSEQLNRLHPPGGLAGKAIANGLDGKGWTELPQYISGAMLRSAEECIAAAELDRAYDESPLTRDAAVRWKAAALPGEEMARCHAALEKLLQRPWSNRLDASSFFMRCHSALARPRGEAEFGSPENCRTLIWRYMDKVPSRLGESHVNPERWDRLEVIRLSGNPWGVDNKLVVAILEEAISSLRSPDADERDAAGTFLDGYWITPDQLPDERLWFVLEHDVSSARKAAITALNRRGKSQQTGQWLADHLDLPGLKLGSLWEASIPLDNRGTFADWELPVALELLDRAPLEASEILAKRSDRINEAGGKLTDELREPIRRFLVRESAAKKVTGQPLPEPGGDPDSVERMLDPRLNEPSQLSSALYLLAEWRKPADTALIREYLTHPAAKYDSGLTDRSYWVRSTAAHILKDRNEEVPDDIVLEERVRKD
jgi:hypothetical protein